MSLAHLTGLVALVLLALAGVALLLVPAIRRARRPALPRRSRVDGATYFERRAAELPRTIETGGHAPELPPAPLDVERQWARRDAQARLDEAQREHEARVERLKAVARRGRDAAPLPVLSDDLYTSAPENAPPEPTAAEVLEAMARHRAAYAPSPVTRGRSIFHSVMAELHELDDAQKRAVNAHLASYAEQFRMRLGLPPEAQRVEAQPTHPLGWKVVCMGEGWYAASPDRSEAQMRFGDAWHVVQYGPARDRVLQLAGPASA